jgi:hypothetical protein
MKRILSYITGKSWEMREQRIEEEAKKNATHPSDILGSSKRLL